MSNTLSDAGILRETTKFTVTWTTLDASSFAAPATTVTYSTTITYQKPLTSTIYLPNPVYSGPWSLIKTITLQRTVHSLPMIAPTPKTAGETTAGETSASKVDSSDTPKTSGLAPDTSSRQRPTTSSSIGQSPTLTSKSVQNSASTPSYPDVSTTSLDNGPLLPAPIAKGISPGGAAGISVGSAFAAAILAAVLVFALMKRRYRLRPSRAGYDDIPIPEKERLERTVVPQASKQNELDDLLLCPIDGHVLADQVTQLGTHIHDHAIYWYSECEQELTSHNRSQMSLQLGRLLGPSARQPVQILCSNY